MEQLKLHFPNLSEQQYAQLAQLDSLYRDWNEKINVISRKDIDNLYVHHVLHSMAIAKYISFKPGAQVMDLGTGGGFPGIPLAILFPETQFTLVDSIRKKLTVVEDVALQLGLSNVRVQNSRAEELKPQFDFVVCRAVATIDKLMAWSRSRIKKNMMHALPNGLIALKGGNIKEELKLLGKNEYSEIVPIQKYFPDEYYDEKYVVYVQG